jgi:6-phosphogluconolactonase
VSRENRSAATSADPSRREFITTSALGLLSLACASGNKGGEEAPVNSTLLYVGTYTEGDQTDGIYILRMNATTAELRQIGAVNAGPNPSFLAVHPNGRFLYAVNEVTDYAGKRAGAVGAFAIARETGMLTRTSEQPSEGGAPCYVSVTRDGRGVLVANYLGGNVALLPIQPTGALAPAAHVSAHEGGGPNAERQEGPHAHCIIPDPSGRFALAADLGIDRVLVYRLDAGVLRHAEEGDARLRPGAGPRHLAFHPTLPLVFVANELDSTVTTLRFDSDRGALTVVDTQPTLPDGSTAPNYPADIHVAANGRAFSVAADTGALALQQAVPTEGDWPRNFALHPTERWVLVANQRSGSVVVFARDPDNGRLTPTRQRIAIPSPVCLRFV